MKPAESKRLYERECKQRRMTFQQEEYELWHRRLREFDMRDVDAALETWSASTERNGQGEIKSKWLPVPAELKSLIISAQRKREAAAREPKDFVAWECKKPEGCGYRCSGWTKEQLAARKNCPRCHRPMHEVLREQAPKNAA